jgi:hypothetical protein
MNQTLLLEAVQRGIDGSDGGISARARLDLLPDGHAVPGPVLVQDRQEDHLLELTEEVAFAHEPPSR